MILPGILSSQISGHLFTLTGSYDALATVTVPSGGASSITFSALPQTGYSHLQIRYMAQTTTNGSLEMRFNGDAAYANYSSHALYGTGSSTGAFSDTGSGYPYMDIGQVPQSTQFGVGIVDILDYANLNKNKTVRTLNGWDGNGSGWISLFSSAWYNSSSAVNSITITTAASTNFNQNSQFTLFGIK